MVRLFRIVQCLLFGHTDAISKVLWEKPNKIYGLKCSRCDAALRLKNKKLIDKKTKEVKYVEYYIRYKEVK